MDHIVALIDLELARLKAIRVILTSEISSPFLRKRGRPIGSVKNGLFPVTKARRTLSAEARGKIAAAQKRRWAAAKKTA